MDATKHEAPGLASLTHPSRTPLAPLTPLPLSALVLFRPAELGLPLRRRSARPAELGLPLQSVRWLFGVSVRGLKSSPEELGPHPRLRLNPVIRPDDDSAPRLDAELANSARAGQALIENSRIVQAEI